MAICTATATGVHQRGSRAGQQCQACNPRPATKLAGLHKQAFSDRATAAADPHAGADTLTSLARTGGVVLRRVVAANIAAPTDVLDRLADDHDSQVRAAVAKNTTTSNGTLRRLIGDPNDEPAYSIARAQFDDRIRGALGLRNTPDFDVTIFYDKPWWSLSMEVIRMVGERPS